MTLLICHVYTRHFNPVCCISFLLENTSSFTTDTHYRNSPPPPHHKKSQSFSLSAIFIENFLSKGLKDAAILKEQHW